MLRTVESILKSCQNKDAGRHGTNYYCGQNNFDQVLENQVKCIETSLDTSSICYGAHAAGADVILTGNTVYDCGSSTKAFSCQKN